MKKIIAVLISIISILSLCGCDKKVTQEETTEPEISSQAPVETTLETISGILYATVNGENKTNDFYCSGGTITPERIAAGFTGWTGIDFGLSSSIDEENKTMTLNFRNSSAVVTKELEANAGFEFQTYDELQNFILESLRETINKNIGDYEITFTADGKAIG